MRRRIYNEQPISRLAIWARRIAFFSLATTLIAVVIVRSGALDIVPALSTLAGALVLACVAILLALGAVIVIWREGTGGGRHAATAVFIGLALIAYPLYLGIKGSRLPAISDITTDPIDPPRFEALARLRTGDGTNTAVYAGLYSAEQQRQYYPDIETVELDASAQRAFDVTMALVAKRKWLVIDARGPQPPRLVGHIEAVARTPIMGFREDVSIRVTPDGDGSRVDIRSASRYFESDLGSNAARVAKLIDDINSAIDNANLKPVKKPVAPVKPPPKVVKK